LFLLTELQDQSYLSVWNGSRWSEPQAQPMLAGFEEPEIYTPISFGCHQAGGFGNRLYVVGCDQGDGSDTWITSRDVGSTDSWFSSQTWTQPVPVSGSEVAISDLEFVSTDDGLVHTVFSQHQDPSVYYTRWDGGTWSRITPVLELPDGEARSPAIAAGPENDLLLIALSSEGDLRYVRAKSNEAVTAKRWSAAARLPTNHHGPVSPAAVAWDASGVVYVAYSVPIYEDRGVYLVTSEDKGETWSKAVRVFDGVEAGFDLVGAPAMLVTPNGHVHIIWKRQTIPTEGASEPISLHYAWSENGGRTFSEPGLVVEGPVTWHRIVADGEGRLHRLWQRSDATSTLWDEVSDAGGHSWQVPQQLPSEEGHPIVALDPAGQLHLVGPSAGQLSHLLWNGSRWRAEAPLPWSSASPQDEPVEVLGGAVNAEGGFVVLLREGMNPGEGTASLIQYTTQHLSLPAGQGTPQGESAEPPLTTSVPTSPAPESSATSPAEELTPAPAPIRSADALTPFLLTVLPSAVLLLAVVGAVALRMLRGRTR